MATSDAAELDELDPEAIAKAKALSKRVRPRFISQVPRGANGATDYVYAKSHPGAAGASDMNEDLMLTPEAVDALKPLLSATIEDANKGLALIEGAAESAEPNDAGPIPPELQKLILGMVARLEGESPAVEAAEQAAEGEGTPGGQVAGAGSAPGTPFALSPVAKASCTAAMKSAIDQLGACLAAMEAGGDEMAMKAGTAFIGAQAALKGVCAKAPGPAPVVVPAVVPPLDASAMPGAKTDVELAAPPVVVPALPVPTPPDPLAPAAKADVIPNAADPQMAVASDAPPVEETPVVPSPADAPAVDAVPVEILTCGTCGVALVHCPCCAQSMCAACAGLAGMTPDVVTAAKGLAALQVAAKAGAVLSKKNVTALEDAQAALSGAWDAIDAVIASNRKTIAEAPDAAAAEAPTVSAKALDEVAAKAAALESRATTAEAKAAALETEVARLKAARTRPASADLGSGGAQTVGAKTDASQAAHLSMGDRMQLQRKAKGLPV